MVVKYAQAEQKNIELVEKLQKAEAAMKDCMTEKDNLTTYLHTLRADKQKLKDLLEKRVCHLSTRCLKKTNSQCCLGSLSSSSSYPVLVFMVLRLSRTPG